MSVVPLCVEVVLDGGVFTVRAGMLVTLYAAC